MKKPSFRDGCAMPLMTVTLSSVEVPPLAFSKNGDFLACTLGRWRVTLSRISARTTGMDNFFHRKDGVALPPCFALSLSDLAVQHGKALAIYITSRPPLFVRCLCFGGRNPIGARGDQLGKGT